MFLVSQRLIFMCLFICCSVQSTTLVTCSGVSKYVSFFPFSVLCNSLLLEICGSSVLALYNVRSNSRDGTSSCKFPYQANEIGGRSMKRAVSIISFESSHHKLLNPRQLVLFNDQERPASCTYNTANIPGFRKSDNPNKHMQNRPSSL